MNADSTIVVGLIKGNMLCNARHYTLIQKCKGLMTSTDLEVMIHYCFHEANKVVANVLANIGIELN